MSSLKTSLPDDATLTDQGLDAHGTGRVLVIACVALAREILAVREKNGWDHIDLTCLPAIYHNFPEKITVLLVHFHLIFQ